MEVAEEHTEDPRKDELVVIDDDAADKKTIEMNFIIRFPSGLGGQVTPAYSTDADEKISRYILFQVAKFAVDHFQPWKKFVLDKADAERAKLVAEGVLHDITGRGHPSLALEVETDEGKKDEFLLENGVPSGR